MKQKLNLPIYLFCLLLFSSSTLRAQESEGVNELLLRPYKPGTDVRVAYLGAVLYPGFSASILRPYAYKRIDKYNLKRNKTVYKERYLAYNLSMYHQFRFHTNLFSQVEWMARRQQTNGFYTAAALGLGVSRTFLSGPTFRVADNGQVEEVPLAGNWYGLASIGWEIGYNARLRLQPFSLHLKQQWLLLFPYNGFLTPRPTFELGVSYQLANFWPAEPRFTSKVKRSRKYRKSNMH